MLVQNLALSSRIGSRAISRVADPIWSWSWLAADSLEKVKRGVGACQVNIILLNYEETISLSILVNLTRSLGIDT